MQYILLSAFLGIVLSWGPSASLLTIIMYEKNEPNVDPLVRKWFDRVKNTVPGCNYRMRLYRMRELERKFNEIDAPYYHVITRIVYNAATQGEDDSVVRSGWQLDGPASAAADFNQLNTPEMEARYKVIFLKNILLPKTWKPLKKDQDSVVVMPDSLLQFVSATSPLPGSLDEVAVENTGMSVVTSSTHAVLNQDPSKLTKYLNERGVPIFLISRGAYEAVATKPCDSNRSTLADQFTGIISRRYNNNGSTYTNRVGMQIDNSSYETIAAAFKRNNVKVITFANRAIEEHLITPADIMISHEYSPLAVSYFLYRFSANNTKFVTINGGRLHHAIPILFAQKLSFVDQNAKSDPCAATDNSERCVQMRNIEWDKFDEYNEIDAEN